MRAVEFGGGEAGSKRIGTGQLGLDRRAARRCPVAEVIASTYMNGHRGARNRRRFDRRRQCPLFGVSR